jgi:DNA invertase Pin-like site-specific DNA recombinase
MRIIAYLRVSTKHQVESSQSLDDQKTACENYARSKGKVVDRFFTDAGISGVKEYYKRPGLNQLLEYLQKGDMLLVSRRDRLAREVGAMERIKEVVKHKKAKIISCADEGTESDDEYDLTAISAYCTSDFMSRMEQAFAKVRVKRALDRKKEKGERLGHIPFGMRTGEDGIHLEPSPEEQEIMRQMYMLRGQGYTIVRACDEMNKRKLFNRDNRPWKKSAFHRILSR